MGGIGRSPANVMQLVFGAHLYEKPVYKYTEFLRNKCIAERIAIDDCIMKIECRI